MIVHFQAVYRMQGLTKCKEKAEEAALQLFLQMDKNKNDVVSEAEFVGGIRSSPAVRDILHGVMWADSDHSLKWSYTVWSYIHGYAEDMFG